jgi:prepilin-type N-terminal cleavage/methylation domain-containing protein
MTTFETWAAHEALGLSHRRYYHRDMTSHRDLRREARSRGFTLIEIVVVLLIFTVVVAMAAAITRGVSAGQKRSLTTARMAAVDAALVQFVLQQKRLPCPADGTLASSANNAGIEVPAGGPCTIANLQNGVIPWRTLALSETDATDGWDRRLTYRLDPALGAANGMDMSWCDAAGTEAVGAIPRPCAVGLCSSASLANCTPPVAFLRGRGLLVKNVAGTVVMDPAPSPSAATPTGAAYVLVSPGESGGGGYLNTGQLSTSTVGDGTEELKNYASLPFTSLTVTYYVDDSISDVPGVTHFDDVVSRPSVLSVVSKAGLAPRTH